MTSEVEVNGTGLLEVDICDDSGLCFEESEFVPPEDGFADFQQWTAFTDSAWDPPQGVPEGQGSSDCEGSELSAAPRASIVDCLLVELYDTYSGGYRRQADSWDSSTEASGSEAFLSRSNTASSLLQELQQKHTRRHQKNYLAQKAPEELQSIIQEVKYRTGLQSTKLIRQLRRRDRLLHKLQKNYDIITACLQAVSQKRRVDTRLKFTIEPSVGKNGFQQWYDALKAVARLPTGIPKEWRKRVWLTLADQYLHSISIDWDKTLRFAFNERSNPDDDSLGIQIVKDLHRTGCSSYCGQEGEQDRVVLKRVLLAYARWNKKVGYCQGFNVLAALILEVTEGNESDALKVMIYLIDKVLPESYFANNLRALSVDMAVFRDLLRLKLPRLSQHLQHLQKAANKEAGGSYEPPLTNVFTMQWFLTMFATCLPAPTVLKIWDSVFFEGSEVLFRVALAIWERLGERIEYCQTADEFYSTMGCLTQEMLEHSLIEPTELMHEVYSMAVFPFPQLTELREKYTYNITPFPTSVKSNGSGGLGSWESDDDADMDDEDAMVTALGCLGPLGGLLAPELQRYQKHLKDQRAEHGNIAELSPGAVGAAGAGRSEHQAAINSMMMERMSTDIYALKKQYARIKKRQQQQSMQLCIRTGRAPELATSPGILQDHREKPSADEKCPATRVTTSQLNNSTVINHLLLGRKPNTPRLSSTLPGARACPAQGSPSRHHRTSSAGSSRGSPWRDHVRAHRRNIARARAQLGFQDSEEKEDEEEVEERKDRKEVEEGKDRKEAEEGKECKKEVEEEKGGKKEAEEKGKESRKEAEEGVVKEAEGVPPKPPDRGSMEEAGEEEAEEEEAGEEETGEEEAGEAGDVVVQLHALDLEDESGSENENSAWSRPPTAVSQDKEELRQETNTDCSPASPPRSPSPPPEDLPLCSSPLPTSSLKPSSSVSGLSTPPASPSSSSLKPSPSVSGLSSSLNASSLNPSPSVSGLSSSLNASSLKPSSSVSGLSSLNASSLKPSSSVSGLSSVLTPPSSFYRTPCPSTPASLSECSSSRSNLPSSPSTPAFTSSAPKQTTFSPFPCVKQPRKSAAARNLGLYGPTSKTPTVHFPQMSRSLGRCSSGAASARR